MVFIMTHIGIALSVIIIIIYSHLILTNTSRVGIMYHFIDEETEANKLIPVTKVK